MRFMVMVPANADSEAGMMPTEKQLADMGSFNEEMAKAGVMIAGEGLHPSSDGARIRFSGGEQTVRNGPFVGAPGLIAGFWLIEASSLQEAIKWMKRAPFDEGVELEIRQIFEEEEFGDEFTPELRERERRLRERLADQR